MFTEPTSGSQVDLPTGKTSTTPDGLSASIGLVKLLLSNYSKIKAPRHADIVP